MRMIKRVTRYGRNLLRTLFETEAINEELNLHEMNGRELLVTLVRWVLNAKEKGRYTIRYFQHDQVIEIILHQYERYLTIADIKQRNELVGKMCHIWIDPIKYRDLTGDEIKRSVNRADIVNRIHGYMMEAEHIWTIEAEQQFRKGNLDKIPRIFPIIHK